MDREQKYEATEALARQRAVKGWAFRDLTEEEFADVKIFLKGGPCPARWFNAYARERETLNLSPKDWDEAYADAAHSLGKGPDWWKEDMSPEEETYCLYAADSVADRPESEDDDDD
jgi:hypothetical protein